MRSKQKEQSTAAKSGAFNGKLRQLQSFLASSTPIHDRQGMLMGALHRAQDIFGYIPREAMECISAGLGVPTAHIYGMATFYNYFSLKPKGKFRIFVCKGTACYVAGGGKILERLKQELGIESGGVTPDGVFSLNITRCLGCCGLSPVMQVNEDIYVRMTSEKVPTILARYRAGRKPQGSRKEKVA